MLVLQPVQSCTCANIQATQWLRGLGAGESWSRYDRRRDKQASQFHETSFTFPKLDPPGSLEHTDITEEVSDHTTVRACHTTRTLLRDNLRFMHKAVVRAFVYLDGASHERENQKAPTGTKRSGGVAHTGA